MFRAHKTLKGSIVKLHNRLVLSALLCGCENWTVKARDAGRITAGEMINMRGKTARYTWTDYKTNIDIAKGLKRNPSFGQNTEEIGRNV
jgi:hypothetical protein